MANYINNLGQVRLGFRNPLLNQTTQSTTSISTSLLQSLFGVWNGDTLGTSLDSSIYGAWNGEISSSVTTLNTSLVSSWNANGNTTDSVGTNNGTTVGGLTYSTGKIGNAFTFNGNSYIQLPDNSLNVTATHSFSVSSWIYITSASTYQSIVSSDEWPNTGTMYGWGLRLSPYNSTKMNVEFYTDWQAGTANPDFLQASNSISLNTWIHVLATRNGSTGVEKIYINGSQVTTRTKSVSFISSPRTITPSIGADKYNSTSVGSYISNGSKIDSVSFWRKELSISEVSALYNSGNSIESPYTTSIDTYIQSPNDSVGTNHGTLVNGTTFTTGKIGNAFSFDGINDYITLADNSLNLTDNFSISFWSYFNNVTNSQIILSSYMIGGSKTVAGIFIELAASQFRFRGYNNGSMVLNTTVSAPTIGVWEHYVWTKDSNSSKVYKNGVLVGTDSNAHGNPNYETISYSLIGANRYNSTTYQEYFNGKLDSMSIWNKVLNVDEITQLYNSGTGAQYPFTGTYSSAGNQLGVDNGTLMNGCTFGDGKIGKAFQFDGVNDYVKLPNNSLNFTGDFTISAWVNFSSFPSASTIIANYYRLPPYAVYYGWSVLMISNQIAFDIFTGVNNSYVRLLSPSIPTNTWRHVTFIHKKNVSLSIYIDGVLSTTTITTTPIGYSGNETPAIGGTLPGDGFQYPTNGKIDAVNVWQRALTQSEITELYNSGNGKQLTTTPIITSGLVLNLDASRTSSYPNSGTTWTDISGNGNNGTLTNGPVFGTASGGQITFDGVNDYVDLGTKSSLAPGTSDFTISFWLNPNNWGSLSSTSYSPIFVTLVNGGLWIGKNGANFVLRTSYIGDDIQYSVLPTVNQWTMVTVNRVGNTAKIYYNTSVVASATVTKNYVSGNSYLGVDIPSNGNFSNIKLSTFNYYNRGLSDSEITQNYNATKTRFGL